jgi:heat shock protein HslJ
MLMRLIACACASVVLIALTACGSAPGGPASADERDNVTVGTSPVGADTDGVETVQLENTRWTLTHLGDRPAGKGAGGEFPNLTFDRQERRVSGFAGCNRIAGEYTLEGRRLSFPALAMTKMGCVEGMELEGRFASALNRTAGWQLTGDRLELLDGGGDLLAVFRATLDERGTENRDF